MAKHKAIQSFYSSPKWIIFRRKLIMQRKDKNGRVICEMCKKPILIAKDITAHHKIELTLENLNDHNISLNPSNIELVCHDCHNKEHQRFGHQTIQEKKVYLVYGAPLSGKRTLVKERAKAGDLIVDMDSIYSSVSGLGLYNKPSNLFTNVMGVYNLLIDNVETRHGKWNNAWIIGGFADKYKRNRMIQKTGAEVIFCDVNQDECLRRLSLDQSRKDSESEWQGYISKWFNQYTE